MKQNTERKRGRGRKAFWALALGIALIASVGFARDHGGSRHGGHFEVSAELTPDQRTELIERRESRAIKELEGVPFDPWSPVVREELFNLRDDPNELDDLSESQPDQLERMRSLLADFEARAREIAPAQQGTAEELSIDEEMAERIRSIGY